MTIPQDRYHFGSFDLGSVSLKRFEWAKTNLDTETAANTFPLNFGRDGAELARFYRTGSGECILDGGAWQFQVYDEDCLCRSLNGRLSGVHKVLNSRVKDVKIAIWDLTVVHDSSAQQNCPGNEDTLQKIGELVRKIQFTSETASSVSS